MDFSVIKKRVKMCLEVLTNPKVLLITSQEKENLKLFYWQSINVSEQERQGLTKTIFDDCIKKQQIKDFMEQQKFCIKVDKLVSEILAK
jgi:hypothetical protein